MKILLLSRYFPPEIGTAANLFHELAGGLTRRGHEVRVITGFPWYNLKEIPEKYNNKVFLKERTDGFDVLRIAFPLPGMPKMKLALGHLTAPLTSAIGGFVSEKPDIIYAYSPPLPMGATGWLLETFKDAPFVMGVQDLHPQCYIDQGVLTNPFMISLLEGLEKFCYRKAAVVTVHSEGNKAFIVNNKGISRKKVQVLPNWIDTDALHPLPRNNAFSEKYRLNDRFVVGYAGTLGMSQGMMSIVEAARLLKHRDDIEFFIVGDGIEKSSMTARSQELGLENIRFIPMQPKSVYPWVVASSDVGLVTLNKHVKTPVVPSKILSMMAAARPVLASMPLDGDAPKLIEKAGCGICVGPENPEAIAEAVQYLADHRTHCRTFGEQGRRFVVDEMSLKTVMGIFEKIFERTIHERKRNRSTTVSV